MFISETFQHDVTWVQSIKMHIELFNEQAKQKAPLSERGGSSVIIIIKKKAQSKLDAILVRSYITVWI